MVCGVYISEDRKDMKSILIVFALILAKKSMSLCFYKVRID